MRSLLIGFLFLMSVSAKANSLVTIQKILSQNIGVISGVVKNDSGSRCSFEVNDTVLPGHYVVYAEMNENVTVMVFPTGLWEINESAKKLTFFVDSMKANSVQMNFDAASLKVNSFSVFSKTGFLPGNTCLLR